MFGDVHNEFAVPVLRYETHAVVLISANLNIGAPTFVRGNFRASSRRGDWLSQPLSYQSINQAMAKNSYSSTIVFRSKKNSVVLEPYIPPNTRAVDLR